MGPLDSAVAAGRDPTPRISVKPGSKRLRDRCDYRPSVQTKQVSVHEDCSDGGWGPPSRRARQERT